MNITLISRVGTTYQLSSVTFESSNKIIWFLKNVDPQTHKSNFPAGWWAIVSKLSKSTHSDWNFMSNVAACGWMPFHCPCVRTCAQKGFCIFQICGGAGENEVVEHSPRLLGPAACQHQCHGEQITIQLLGRLWPGFKKFSFSVSMPQVNSCISCTSDDGRNPGCEGGDVTNQPTFVLLKKPCSN